MKATTATLGLASMLVLAGCATDPYYGGYGYYYERPYYGSTYYYDYGYPYYGYPAVGGGVSFYFRDDDGHRDHRDHRWRGHDRDGRHDQGRGRDRDGRHDRGDRGGRHGG